MDRGLPLGWTLSIPPRHFETQELSLRQADAAPFAGGSSVAIHYHLPDFFFLFDLNRALIERYRANPGMFYDGIKIASVYGSFPNAIWNGGRLMLGATNYTNIKDTIE
jgi:hypothetical protein